jgi:hypothetical protein
VTVGALSVPTAIVAAAIAFAYAVSPGRRVLQLVVLGERGRARRTTERSAASTSKRQNRATPATSRDRCPRAVSKTVKAFTIAGPRNSAQLRIVKHFTIGEARRGAPRSETAPAHEEPTPHRFHHGRSAQGTP